MNSFIYLPLSTEYKWIMKHYLTEQFSDVFDVFVDGDYKIEDISQDSLVIFNEELDVNLLWFR